MLLGERQKLSPAPQYQAQFSREIQHLRAFCAAVLYFTELHHLRTALSHVLSLFHPNCTKTRAFHTNSICGRGEDGIRAGRCCKLQTSFSAHKTGCVGLCFVHDGQMNRPVSAQICEYGTDLRTRCGVNADGENVNVAIYRCSFKERTKAIPPDAAQGSRNGINSLRYFFRRGHFTHGRERRPLSSPAIRIGTPSAFATA